MAVILLATSARAAIAWGAVFATGCRTARSHARVDAAAAARTTAKALFFGNPNTVGNYQEMRIRVRVPRMRAMILAAGLGTRLRPLTEQAPKPALPVVDVPNIVRTIAHLWRAGITEIVVNLHHCPEVLRALLGDGAGLGVSIAYSEERPEILGTGGGIRRAKALLGDQTFCVVNGDALFAPDLEAAVAAHRRSGAIATMVVREDPDAVRLGAVGIDGQSRVRRLVDVGAQRGDLALHMFTGVHVLEPEIFPLLPESGCIVRTTYQALVRAGGPLGAFVERGWFCDLGTPRTYLEANVALASGRIRFAGYDPPPAGVHVGEGAILGAGSALRGGTVVERGARVGEGVVLERCLVRAGASADASAADAIFCEGGLCIRV
jgi:mannose-1-phosphate guanylyltransferase